MRNFLSIFLIFTFFACCSSKNIIIFCDKEYIKKSTPIFLTDENIETTMVQVIEKKSKKFIFGYYLNAIRNDTNFIFSHVNQVGDTIINKTYRLYKITEGVDSSVAKYICTKNGILFYSNQNYWNGQLKKIEYFNYIMVKD